MVWKKWGINAIVNGYKFYIILWLGINKKFLLFLNDLFLCFFWSRTSSSLSGSAWGVFFFDVLMMVGAVYRLYPGLCLRLIHSQIFVVECFPWTWLKTLPWFTDTWAREGFCKRTCTHNICHHCTSLITWLFYYLQVNLSCYLQVTIL